MQYFGNSGEMLLLTAPPVPFPRWGKMLPPPLKLILEEYWIPKLALIKYLQGKIVSSKHNYITKRVFRSD
jgi:hypothetical protein